MTNNDTRVYAATTDAASNHSSCKRTGHSTAHGHETGPPSSCRRDDFMATGHPFQVPLEECAVQRVQKEVIFDLSAEDVHDLGKCSQSVKRTQPLGESKNGPDGRSVACGDSTMGALKLNPDTQRRVNFGDDTQSRPSPLCQKGDESNEAVVRATTVEEEEEEDDDLGDSGRVAPAMADQRTKRAYFQDAASDDEGSIDGMGDASLALASSAPRPASSMAQRSTPSLHTAHIRGNWAELWRQSVASTITELKVARRFRTLRNFNSFKIRQKELQPLEVLGQGAFAVVEKCLYLPQKRVVAVKRLKFNTMQNKTDVKGMIKETALLRKLHNKYIIEYIGCGSWDKSTSEAKDMTLFLVEEYLDGGTLKGMVTKSMRANKQLYRTQDALRWLLHIAYGLEYLHESIPMVIHRDLKLENILLQGIDPHTSVAKIADFGLSALVHSSSSGHLSVHQPSYNSGDAADGSARPTTAENNIRRQATVQTQRWTDNAKRRVKGGAADAKSGKVPDKSLHVKSMADRLSGRTGTLMYMAPEVYRKELYNEKADVFSFGIIAYEILHRYMMISATDGSFGECEAYARRVARSGYRPPLDESLPQQLRSLISSCWRSDPKTRPSMGKVVKYLLEVQKVLCVDEPVAEAKGTGAKEPVKDQQREEAKGCTCCVQ